jgi:subfamily B ATP-binding cassette protein HlyB/CyaB
LWLLGSLAQSHRIAFDAELAAREATPPLDDTSLQLAARHIGLVTAAHRCDGPIDALPLPCVAWLRGADGTAQAATAERSAANGPAADGDRCPATPALIVRADADRLLYFEACSDLPHTVPAAQFETLFEPEVLLAKRAPEAAPDPDVGTAPKPFGLSWFAPEFLKHKRIWREVLVVSLVMQVLGLATPLLTQVVIDKVVVHHTISTLTVVGAGLIIAVLFSAAFGWLRQYLVIHTGNRIDAVLGSSALRHLFRLPLSYFQQRPTGVLVARLRGVETIREFLAGGLVALLLDLPFMAVLLAVMFIYSWQLTLIAVALLVLLTGLSLAVTPVFRARLDHQFLVGARNQSFITEYTAGIETVKSLQMEPLLEARYGDLLGDYLAAGFRTRQLANGYNVAANTLEQIQTLAILVAGALLVMRSDGFTVGMLVAFQMIAARLSQPLLKLVGLYQELQQVRVAILRLGDIMNMPEEPYGLIAVRPRQAGQRGARIDLQDLGFRYDDRQPWLYRHMNLQVPAGMALAVMGPSGCGKSTLAKLLQGFHLPQEGRILIDGTDLRHLSANELRGYYGVVPQETILFSGTLYDNLLAGNPHAAFEDLVTACRMAEIHAFIESLPKGYQTEVGERGVGLSGGQRQRIAIARALLKRPRVLVFDEATSALDPATAEQLVRTINGLQGAVTLLFIAHQLPKGLRVDGIVRIAPRPTVVTQEATAEEAE